MPRIRITEGSSVKIQLMADAKDVELRPAIVMRDEPHRKVDWDRTIAAWKEVDGGYETTVYFI